MKSKRRAPGSYSPGSTSIKIQFSGDLDVTAHEIGHALDDRHNIMDKVLASHAAVAELDQFSKFGSKPPSGHPYPKRYVAGEGIAEFIRALVVNPTEAQKVAPELYSIFQSSVPAGDRKVITDFSNDVRVWAGQTHLARTISQIEWEPEKKDGLVKEIINPKKSNKMLRYTWANRLAANYVNPMNFFNKAFKYAMSEKGVTDVFEKDDPRFLVRLLYSVDGKFGEMFEKGITTVDGVVHIDGNGKPKNYQWLLEPLHNQDEATIKREMQLVTAYMVSERVVELSDRFNREDILSGVGGGIYKDVEAARAALEEITKGGPAQLTRIREAAARYREFAGHVLRYMVDSGRLSEEQYQKIKEDNTHYVAMHRIMEAEPEQEVVAYTTTGGAKLGSTKEVLNKIKGSTKKISNPYVSLIDILHKAVAESDRNNVMSKFTDMIEATRGMNEGAVENLADVGQKGEGANAITVFKNGKPQKWVLHPDIYRALKGIDHDYLKLPAWATWHARTLRAMTTKFPTFAIRNVAKDIQSKLILSNEGGGLRDYAGSAEDWNTLALRGGLNAGFYTKNKATYYGMMKGAMFEMAKDKGNIIANPTRLKKVWHWYEKQLFKSETTTRVAEYRAAFRKAKANGRDDYSASIYAAYKARDLVDFAVAGHHVRVINQVIPFTNAAVQGLRSAILKAKENPAGFLLRTVVFSVLPQMAEWFINHWDDDTAKEYEDMPAYRKDMFYNFKLGKNFWLSVPKPYELALVGAGVKRGLSKYWGHDQRAKDHAFENYGESAFKALSPVDETSIGGPFAGLIENLANYDFFRDKAIVPPYENKPNLALHHTEVASRLGQVLQKAVGVDARKLDHLLQSEFSYVGKFGMDLSDIGDKKSRPHFSAQDFGIFKQSPGYDGAAVQRMLKYADDAALTQDAGYKKFVLLSRKYFAAEGDEAKEKEGKILRVAAELLLDKWERKDVLNKKIKKFKAKQER